MQYPVRFVCSLGTKLQIHIHIHNILAGSGSE